MDRESTLCPANHIPGHESYYNVALGTLKSPKTLGSLAGFAALTKHESLHGLWTRFTSTGNTGVTGETGFTELTKIKGATARTGDTGITGETGFTEFTGTGEPLHALGTLESQTWEPLRHWSHCEDTGVMCSPERFRSRYIHAGDTGVIKVTGFTGFTVLTR